MSRRVLNNRAGFTLVELIMAMAFFSFMMIILSIGVIQVMKIYQNNLSARRTQQASRTVIEDITREVHGAVRIPVADVATQRLCLEGAQTVEYQRVAEQLIKKVLQGSCDNNNGGASQVLVGSEDVQIRQFDTEFLNTAVGGDANSVRFTITLTTGAEDLLSGNVCKPGTGSQYCSSTTQVGTVTIRGGEQ